MFELELIGRESEVQLLQTIVDPAIAGARTSVLCIGGRAGTGKTRLLREVEYLFPRDRYPLVLIPRFLDFDEPELHIPGRLEEKLADLLGGDSFRVYSELAKELAIVRDQKVPRSIQELEQRLSKEFTSAFNQLSQRKRVVLRFDTTEALRKAYLWARLAEYLPNLRNSALILAGRNALEVARHFETVLPGHVATVTLAPFVPQNAMEYFEKKEAQLGTSLTPDLRDKVVWLIGGSPILLDLAAEWLSREEESPEWLTELSLQQIQSLEPAEIERRRADLERNLVLQFATNRTPRDRLITVLAHVYPLEEHAIPLLVGGLTPTEASTLVSEMKQLMFVKSLPGDRIKLHDYVQELAEKYLLPLEVQRGGSIELLCEQYLNYLDSRIRDERDRLHRSGTSSRLEVEARLYTFLEPQRLEHLFDLDPLRGSARYRELLLEVDKIYNIPYRESITVAFEQRLERRRRELPEALQFELDYARCETAMQVGDYEKASEVLDRNLSPLAEADSERSVKVKLLAGNVYVNLGKIEDGKAAFERAVDGSRDADFPSLLVEAEESLGWTYRLTSKWNEARGHYSKALIRNAEISGPDKDRQEASLLTNLAFVQSYLRRDTAYGLIRRAVEKWESIGDKEGLGRAYSTQGCLYYHGGEYEPAQKAFRQALDIFEPANHTGWISVVLSWRGATYLAVANQRLAQSRTDEAKEILKLAEEDLRNSLDLGPRRDRAMTLNRLARVILAWGQESQGKELLAESYELSLETSNVLYQIASLRDLARIAVKEKDFASMNEFEQKTRAFVAKWGKIEDFTLGGMYLYLGALALGNPSLGLEMAVARLSEGLELISSVRNYAAQDFEYYSKELDRVLKAIATPQTIQHLGHRLLEFWAERDELMSAHPEAIVTFSNWMAYPGQVSEQSRS